MMPWEELKETVSRRAVECGYAVHDLDALAASIEKDTEAGTRATLDVLFDPADKTTGGISHDHVGPLLASRDVHNGEPPPEPDDEVISTPCRGCEDSRKGGPCSCE